MGLKSGGGGVHFEKDLLIVPLIIFIKVAFAIEGVAICLAGGCATGEKRDRQAAGRSRGTRRAAAAAAADHGCDGWYVDLLVRAVDGDAMCESLHDGVGAHGVTVRVGAGVGGGVGVVWCGGYSGSLASSDVAMQVVMPQMSARL